ncbi:MAG: polysaccharide deacetylase family protein [Rhodanobacter sp.]
MKLPTLMYHDVVAPDAMDASGFPGPAAGHYKLDEAAFAEHVRALSESGLRFVAVDAMEASGDGCCLLTFDDGGASARRVADALSAEGMIGHFLITTARIGTHGFVSADDLRALQAQGHVVGSHSHTHPVEISRLDAAQLESEWQQSVQSLSQILGVEVTTASVPGGFYSTPVAKAAIAAGIRFLFTSEPTVQTQVVDGCVVLGRYALWRGMDARAASALALGKGALQQRQWLAWNVKKPLKRWARPFYRHIRNQWLGGG